MTSRLAFDRVACLRGGRLLFEAMSFDLGPGDAALLTGPNGVGKSSLMRIAAGLLRAAAGSVTREGAIAFAGEQAALDARLPLGQALGFWAGIDRAGAAEVTRGLDAMAIAHLARVPVRMLSTGQRKRAVIAQVIAGRAPIWLLDEPANGLDPAARERLASAVALHRSQGGIVLAATHQPLGIDDAREIALAVPA